MKITVHISTGYVGCSRSEEVDDDDLDGMDDDERFNYLDEIAREKMFEMIEWGWREVS